MDEEIKKLVKITTIVRVDNNTTRKIEFGDEYLVSRYNKNHLNNYTKLQQINLEELEGYWNKKWDSFGNKWSNERQNYRFFYDIFQLFYYNFYQLKQNKIASIQNCHNHDKMTLYNKFVGVNLYGVYNYDKKCIDLVRELDIEKLLNIKDGESIKKFSETRNKLLEHNFNPKGFKLRIDPSIWSLAGTHSFMDIIVHRGIEREYDVQIDYYEDYYKLENILVKIVKKF
ncbi:hypothetical protein KAJ61_01380 [Candidatus Parcubacteria bacterium]|nr:hypothetical protein [Candidatus Parcubacteria bacterium]